MGSQFVPAVCIGDEGSHLDVLPCDLLCTGSQGHELIESVGVQPILHFEDLLFSPLIQMIFHAFHHAVVGHFRRIRYE